jgi:DNA gyrase subunit A
VDDRVCLATRNGRATVFPASEVPVLKAAGKGVTGIKTREGGEVMAFELASGATDGPTVTTSFGRQVVVRERAFGLGRRGARGKVVLRRGSIDTWVRGPEVRTDDKAALPLLFADDALPVADSDPSGEE